MANLQSNILGLACPNPIWTAAGPTASDAAMLLRAARGGAGGLVTKTISVRPADVPIPNISSPSPGSLLNAERWSELDYRGFIDHELPRIREAGLPVIVSLGYSAEDLAKLGAAIERSHTADAVEFSIHYVDKHSDNLRRTAASLKNAVSVPVFAKLSPAVQNILEAVRALDDIVDGYAAVNSVGPALDFDPASLQPYLGSADGRGWLSGRAILPIGLHYIASLAQLTGKPLIGVGGIRAAEDVVKYVMAGASAVQVCSWAILKGQNVYGKLAADLSRWMDTHGYTDLQAMRGAFHRREQNEVLFLGDAAPLHPQIAYEKCTFCDLCVKSCVHEALVFENRRFLVNSQQCVSCGLCASICPTDALAMQRS